ncbi:MAG TPA: TonB family protein [Flavobacteriales bacterium]|nr:TonB family protein [Flavobacteriales bacterium]
MRRGLAFSWVMMLAAAALAQPDSALVGVRVEKFPQFPGGESALHRYLKKELRRPKSAPEMMGTVYLTFMIDTLGSLHDVHVKRGMGHGFDEEAMRCARAMPKWDPATVHGKPINVQYVLPVRFDRRTRRR